MTTPRVPLFTDRSWKILRALERRAGWSEGSGNLEWWSEEKVVDVLLRANRLGYVRVDGTAPGRMFTLTTLGERALQRLPV